MHLGRFLNTAITLPGCCCWADFEQLCCEIPQVGKRAGTQRIKGILLEEKAWPAAAQEATVQHPSPGLSPFRAARARGHQGNQVPGSSQGPLWYQPGSHCWEPWPFQWSREQTVDSQGSGKNQQLLRRGEPSSADPSSADPNPDPRSLSGADTRLLLTLSLCRHRSSSWLAPALE